MPARASASSGIFLLPAISLPDSGRSASQRARNVRIQGVSVLATRKPTLLQRSLSPTKWQDAERREGAAAPSRLAHILNCALLRGGRERRQLSEVALIMLDDDGRLEIGRDLFETLDRGDGLGAVGVEGGHAVLVVVLTEVREIATEQHIAGLRQLDQQGVMPGRVPRRVQHKHAAITEHVLVERHRLDLALALDPARERLRVHAGAWLSAGQRIPVALADQERRLRKRSDLADMVTMIMTDADILDLLGRELQLCQEVHEARLRRDRPGAHGVAGIPDHVLVAMLDEIAAEDELHLQVAIGIGVGEPEIHLRWRLTGAALEASEGDFRLRLRRGRQADERVGADADRQQAENPLHWFPPEVATKAPDKTERCCPDVEAWSTLRYATEVPGVEGIFPQTVQRIGQI